jgi:excisionase family DNA binding protein
MNSITPGAAATIIGVTTETIRRWCDVGYLPCYRLPSGQRRIPVDAVLDLRLKIAPLPERALAEAEA